MRRISAALLTLAGLAPAGCAVSSTGPLAGGSWGGEGIRLEVTDAGAEVEFDCAVGIIAAPLRLDGGAFDAPGIFTLSHGGPVRVDEPPDTRAARYSGRLRGEVLTLEADVTGIADPVGPFVLRRGVQPLLRKWL